LIVYAVVDDALSPDFPLGDALEVFVCREDAERFVEKIRGDDPELASYLRIEEREILQPADRGAGARGGWEKLAPGQAAGTASRALVVNLACRPPRGLAAPLSPPTSARVTRPGNYSLSVSA
jgi:hypothetical protein